MPLSQPNHPDLPGIERKIQATEDDGRNCQHGGGNVRINQPVQIMEQEATVLRLDAGLALEPILEQSQRTRPRKQFHKDSPDQGSDMQPAQDPVRACQQGTENDPQDE